MSLQEKIIKLKLDAVLAARHAEFWQKAINEHGEDKATEFYKHLGLNHLEKKSIEWEGLRLSREPKEHEKIAVKGIANAQESSKESISKVLLTVRDGLIADGLKGIRKLKPATYHELTLQVSSEARESLRDRLVKVHRAGRLLVAAELNSSKGMRVWPHECPFEFAVKEAVPKDEFDDLDDLTDLTDSRIANDVQARVIAAAQRWILAGKTGSDLWDAVANEINTGSVTYIDRAAAELAHKVIAFGRADEMRNRSDEIGRYEYSALLDVNTCEPCAALDGTTAQSMDELPEVPLQDCLGGAMCRCFIVAIAD